MSIESDWQRVTALFDAVLGVRVEERERLFARFNADGIAADAAIVNEVRTLLAAHQAADDRYDRPIALRLSPTSVDTIAPLDSLLRAGRVGAFNIVRKIGEGGMGAVYEATRSDVTYQQRVAIKTIARGARSDVIATRFRRERQILAGLQHPNIAGLLDGGVTDDGLPYFVMEYVDGLPIDQWCCSRTLSITQRLDLMQQVCRGVQHAHQRLVVHRDLKPQNVFVSHDGVVKLLDFGIAKLSETSGSDGSELEPVTKDGPSPLTAAYASPEQLRGDPASAAGDVYSLGVMLYELLADVPPFPAPGRTAAELANDVLSTMPLAPSVACTDAAAKGCGEGDRTRLAKRLSGELDAIVLMAMRKEPERRYHSVEALGADIQRYLRQLPVSARPDTLGYRVQRYVSRNRWLVTMSAMLVTVALLAGAAIWRQALVSNREARRTARVAEFLQSVLGVADVTVASGMLPRLGPNASMGALLDSALRRVPTEFSDDPAVRARLYLTIGSSRIAQSRMREASDVLDSAIVLSRATRGVQNDVFVLANLNAGAAALHRNRLATSRALTRSAQQALIARGDTTSELYAHALTDLAAIAQVSGVYDSMSYYATHALSIETRRTRAPTIQQGIALTRLATAAAVNEQWLRGDSLLSQAHAVLSAVVPPSNLSYLDLQLAREDMALHFSRMAQADSIVTTGIASAIATYGARSREHAIWLGMRGLLAGARGNAVVALDATSDAVHMLDSIPEVVSSVRAAVYLNRNAVSIAARDWAASDSILRLALHELEPVKRGLQLVAVYGYLAIVLVHENQLVEADSMLVRARRANDTTPMHAQWITTMLHQARAYMYDRAGDSASVAREVAQIPVSSRDYLRAFIAKQRILDAQDAKRRRP